MDEEDIMVELQELLEIMIEKDASDLHITTGGPPRFRIDGRLVSFDHTSLTASDTKRLCYSVLTDAQRHKFEEEWELDFSFGVKGLSRFRGNIYMQRGAVAGAFRAISFEIFNLSELGIPPVVNELISRPKGLVLVTGPTGTGKSTTLAAMIDKINSEKSSHIVTIEDPIEYMFQHRKSLVTQREVGMDTFSFKEALKNTLRQAPNVIYIGELRDADTVEFALHSAETGHLVLSTLHSTNASQTVERVLNFFPRDFHDQVLTQLSYNLKAIVSQRLIPSESGKRVPVLEVLINTAFVQEVIQKGEIGKLKKLMESGRQEGMQTFDLHLKELVEKGVISEDKALIYADSPSDLRLKLRGFA